IAERAEGARRCPQARLALRYHVDVVLPVTPRAQAGRAVRHAALAGPAIHRLGPIGGRRHRPFSTFRPGAGRGWQRGWRGGGPGAAWTHNQLTRLADFEGAETSAIAPVGAALRSQQGWERTVPDRSIINAGPRCYIAAQHLRRK